MNKYIIALINALLFGCFQVIGQGSLLKISEVTSIVATCNVDNGALPAAKKQDGSIKVSWTGGTGKYKVLLYNNAGSLLQSHNDIDRYWDQFNNLSSGNYSVKVEDVLGSFVDTTYALLSKSEIVLSPIPYPVNCKGERNGKIRLEVNSTTQFVTFALNDTLLITTSDTNTTFTGLAGGNYKVKVTNSDGCFDSIPKVLVYEPKSLIVSNSVINVNKYGDTTGQIYVVISGGASPYKYSFSDSDLVKLDSGRTASQINKHGLTSGNYNFTIADANNCRVNLKDIFIWQPEQLILSCEVKNVSCYGKQDGSITLSATGGLGNYTFGITDSITGTMFSFENLMPNNSPYKVFVRDTAGVEQSKAIFITQPDNLVSEIEKVYSLRCNSDNSGAVKLNIKGGSLPYYISTDSSNWILGDSISKLAANNILKVFTKDKNNCQTSTSTSINQPETLKLQLDSVVRPLCRTNEGKIYTSSSGGTVSGKYNYEWNYTDSAKIINNQENFLKNIYAGEYIVKVMDDNNCSDTINVLVSDINDQHFDSVLLQDISCYNGKDGKIEIFVSGGIPGYRYYLNDIETEKATAGLIVGNYKLKSIDAVGCILLTKVSLTQPDSLSVKNTIVAPTCYDSNDGSITLTVTGGTKGYSYKWDNGDTISAIYNIGKGKYQTSISDSHNCTLIKSYDVTAPSALSAKWTENNVVICTGNNIKLDGGEYLKYEWYKDHSLIDTVHRSIVLYQTGDYILKITDKNGCKGTDTFQLKVSDHPLEASLLLPDSAFVGELARVIDVTWPVPDSIKWFYDKSVQIDSTNTWSESFVSYTEGLITVTLRAYSGGCFSDSSKTILYHDTVKYEQKKAREENTYILEYTLYPVPNNGAFNVGVKLSCNAQIRLSLFAAGELVLMDQKLFNGQENYTVDFNNRSLKPGAYLLLLEAGNNKQVKKFIKTY
jgi:hypothetical protein